ncbi:MAG: hypothetical protein ACK4SA_13995, partial [Caldilinea sp.]
SDWGRPAGSRTYDYRIYLLNSITERLFLLLSNIVGGSGRTDCSPFEAASEKLSGAINLTKQQTVVAA